MTSNSPTPAADHHPHPALPTGSADGHTIAPYLGKTAVAGFLLVGLLTTLIHLAGLTRVLDLWGYDALLRASAKPPSGQVVVVAVDERSIRLLGRWPWRRVVTAAVLPPLRQAKVVGLDVYLSEPDRERPWEDDMLSSQIRQHGRVVLPVALNVADGLLQVTPPLPAFGQSAVAVGHAGIPVDPDGIVRRVDLKPMDQGQPLQQFSMAMLQAGQAGKASERLPGHAAAPYLIPFPKAPDHAPRVSLVDVLQGKVPSAYFKDKYVLVGVVASGLSDVHPTPVSGVRAETPGVEILADVLDGLVTGRLVQPLSMPMTLALSLSLILLAVLALERGTAGVAFIGIGGLVLLALLTSLLLFRLGFWFRPATAVVSLLLTYPVWSWLRLRLTHRHLEKTFAALQSELEFWAPGAQSAQLLPGNMEARISRIERVADRLSLLRNQLMNSWQGLPDATLLTSDDGEIVFANRAAQRILDEHSLPPDPIHRLNVLLGCCHPVEHQQRPDWPLSMSATRLATFPDGIEVQTLTGRILLIRCTEFDAPLDAARWVLTLTDISGLRRAERHRDEALQFLSHDIRTPLSSTLSLIRLRRNSQPEEGGEQAFLDQMEAHTQRSLTLVGDFLQQARAEGGTYRMTRISLSDLLVDAIDELWAKSRSRGVTLLDPTGPADLDVTADRAMLTRVFVNLYENAIRYSAPGTRVSTTLTVEDGHVRCAIQDQGPGIAPEQLPLLFNKYHRTPEAEAASPGGTGLGLAFVKAVVERHRGKVDVRSELGRGSCFSLLLSLAEEAAP